jgi:shikimate kinase
MTGVGKTTIGKLLADRLSVPFVDLDSEIESRTGMTIPEMFAAFGEQGFRDKESEALFSLERKTEGVVALGAGALERDSNLGFVDRTGTLIYLRANVDLLMSRELITHNRPMLLGAETPELLRHRLAELLERREPRYLKAQIVVDMAPDMTSEQISETLVMRLENSGSRK